MQAGSSERKPDRKPTSWTARILAPLGLVGVVVAVVVVVGGSLDTSDDDRGRANRKGQRASATTTTTPGCQPAADKAVKEGYYVIKPGEAGLSAVADKTCIPVERLTELNPNLDPQLIPVAACVDLVPRGCKKLAQK